jgi:hypothetical protein
MKTVSFVQVNFQLGPKDCNSYHLPYSVGCLWAYAYSHESIQRNFQLGHVTWRRDPVEQVVDVLKDSDVVGFSTYIWNRNYNAGVARRLKEINPDCKIIFGGPEPAISDPDIFKKNPWITAVIKNEGEIVFHQVLENLDTLTAVPGLLVNHQGQVIDTGDAERIQDLSQLPSPYSMGFFDDIVKNNPDIEWAATVETNRGCPYQCTFCDWGSLTYNKIKTFPLSRVFDEMTWTAQHKITLLTLADANFGILPDRDPAVAEKFVDLQNQYGYPEIFITNFAKNQKKEVVDIVHTLIKKSKNYNTGLLVSLQTMDAHTLDIIKRKNLEINKIEEILTLAREKNLPVSTELILGLPGETLQSWNNNIWRLLELDMHDGIDIYYAQLLENAELNQVQKEIYDIDTVEVFDYFTPFTDENIGEYAESTQVTKSTRDLSFQDMIQASVLNWFISTWHIGGFSDMISRFLRRYHDLPYEKFYTDLQQDLAQQTWYQTLENQQRDMLIDWFTHGRITMPNTLNLPVYGNNIIYYTRQVLHSASALRQEWYTYIDQYLHRYNLDTVLHQDLITLQKSQVIDMQDRNNYPRNMDFAHNIWQYIMHDQPLQKQPCQLRFAFPEKNMSDSEYMERMYWNRKRRFGRTWIENP